MRRSAGHTHTLYGLRLRGGRVFHPKQPLRSHRRLGRFGIGYLGQIVAVQLHRALRRHGGLTIKPSKRAIRIALPLLLRLRKKAAHKFRGLIEHSTKPADAAKNVKEAHCLPPETTEGRERI